MVRVESVPQQMVEWLDLGEYAFGVSWHALICLGISRFVELFDPSRPYSDHQQAATNVLMGCFGPIREWAKNEKDKRGEGDSDKIGVWEVFRELRPQHVEMEIKIRYARRFWSRLYRIQCISMKALTVFEAAGVPDDYNDTSKLIHFLFSDKMPGLLSRIRNNEWYRDNKPVYRPLHLFDAVLLMDLMLLNDCHIPVRGADGPNAHRRMSARLHIAK